MTLKTADDVFSNNSKFVRHRTSWQVSISISQQIHKQIHKWNDTIRYNTTQCKPINVENSKAKHNYWKQPLNNAYSRSRVLTSLAKLSTWVDFSLTLSASCPILRMIFCSSSASSLCVCVCVVSVCVPGDEHADVTTHPHPDDGVPAALCSAWRRFRLGCGELLQVASVRWTLAVIK